jgi:hypothetical protein
MHVCIYEIVIALFYFCIVIIGQSCSPIHYQLFHERIASYRQPLYDTVNAADSIELPHTDDGSTIVVVIV